MTKPHKRFSSIVGLLRKGSTQPLCSWSWWLLPSCFSCLVFPAALPHRTITFSSPSFQSSPYPQANTMLGSGPGWSLRLPSQLATATWTFSLLHLFFQRVKTVLLSTLGVSPLENRNLYSAFYLAILPQLNLVFLEGVPSINPAFVLSPCNNKT